MRIGGKRSKPVTETQMVSLADIAFLVIFFFLLTSSFMRDRKQVAVPELPKTSSTDTSVSVTMDSDGNIFLDGDPVRDSEALEGHLKDKLAGKTDPKDCEVRFKCDKTVKYKLYRPVYEAIANAGGVIAIIHDIGPATP